LYSIAELRALCDTAHAHGLITHLDGARFGNAVAALGCHPAELTLRAGVDVFSFGGTKNGGLVTEAVLFFQRELADEFDWRRKQAGQLASKMRGLAASWSGLLEDYVWIRNARRANEMAQRLAKGMAGINGVETAYPVEANAVFVNMPKAHADALQARGWTFYPFGSGGPFRFMCSWCTTPEAVDLLLADCAATAPP
jgi:threonine aldolase